MFRVLFCALLVLATAAPSWGQYRWQQGPSEDQVNLYFGPNLVGAYRYSDSQYFPWAGFAWQAAAAPPVAPPIANYGVDRGHFAGRERTTYNGLEITPANGRRLLGAPESIPVDKDKPFWVVVGTEAQCEQAKALLDQPAYAEVARIQAYRPGEAMIADRNGKVMYSPGITLVAVNGQVLGHTDRFDSAEDLQEGLRLLDPSFTPEKLPSLKDRAVTAAVGPLIPHLAIAAGGLLLLGVLAAVALSRRSKA